MSYLNMGLMGLDFALGTSSEQELFRHVDEGLVLMYFQVLKLN